MPVQIPLPFSEAEVCACVCHSMLSITPGCKHCNYRGLDRLIRADEDKYEIAKGTFAAVAVEFDRAIAKHGVERLPAHPAMTNEQCLTVLVEEVGEVARAMTYDNGDPQNLHDELIQVATMALAWVEGLKKKKLVRGAS